MTAFQPPFDEARTNPGLDCLTGHHLDFDIVDERAELVGSWCSWCGTATYDGDRITEDGEPVGFEPTFVVRVPDGFHRHPGACS